MWKSIDEMKADGWSFSIIYCALALRLSFGFINNKLLAMVVFLTVLFLSGTYLLLPHAKTIEQWLFSLNPALLRRIIILTLKGFAFFIAVSVGMATLANGGN